MSCHAFFIYNYINSYKYAVAVVCLVLDYLGGKIRKGLYPHLHILVLVFHLYFLVPFAFSGAAKQGKAALLGVVWVGLLYYFGVEHYHVFPVTNKADYAFFHAYHIGSHAHAPLLVGFQRVTQVIRCLYIVPVRRLRPLPQKNRVVHKFFYHKSASLLPYRACDVLVRLSKIPCPIPLFKVKYSAVGAFVSRKIQQSGIYIII